MRGLIVAAGLATVVGCEVKGSAGPAPSTPAEKRSDIKIDTPGVKVDIEGRRPTGTGGKRDIDVKR